jgi:hypothetical protein
LTDFYPGLVRFSSSTGGGFARFPVAHSEGETPLPIPNRAVKPLSADGTWRATSWESRSPPVFPYRSGALAGVRRGAPGARERARPSQCRGVCATGSRPYSPSVAKSMTRSTASAIRPVSVVFVSSMGSQSRVVPGRLPDPAHDLASGAAPGLPSRISAARRSRGRTRKSGWVPRRWASARHP